VNVKPGRNDPCSCGSGKKYKNCCLGKAEYHPAEPSSVECNQLNALSAAKRFAELENRARSMAGQYPNSGFAWKLLGESLYMQGKDALQALQKATQLLPNDADVFIKLAIVLTDLGQFNEAVACCRRALKIKPDDARAFNTLGSAQQGLGLFQDALASYRNALEIDPDYFKAHNNLGNALQNLGRSDDAAASYRRALQINPGYAEAHYNLGNNLRDSGQPDAAMASYRRALEIKPDYLAARNNLGLALHDLGLPDDAAASYRRALQIKPDHVEAFSNLLFCLSHSEAADAQALFAEHRRFAERFEAPLQIHWPQHRNSRDPERRLQVGFVSGDLWDHAVVHFIEPVLAHLAGYPQLSLHAYYNHVIEDDFTRRLRGYLTHWHSIVGLPDDALAQKIREDGIDILIDLSGHTGKHRLLTFARKPAPVQVSWIGYPGTTGLSAMDYYLADRFFLPPGQFDGQFTEKIVRLPAIAPFLPNESAPPVNVLPALSNGYMTFGSFNRPNKITRSVIALWAQLLRALPDSRMLLGAMSQDGNYTTLIEWFAQEGIERERLDFHVRSGIRAYLGQYQNVDICLDTFPYNGGTTTCHAVWMGVPTLTMTGSTPAGRAGAAVMGHVGLDGFVAHDAADFVQKGLSWAGDLAALSDIRMGLRERFAKSAMGQPAVVAEGLVRALRIIWQRWCTGMTAESFEVNRQVICNTMQETNT
jgi:protein O-GlcNAc transferase